jgi:hypothetical protein
MSCCCVYAKQITDLQTYGRLQSDEDSSKFLWQKWWRHECVMWGRGGNLLFEWLKLTNTCMLGFKIGRSYIVCLFVFGATAPQWARASSVMGFLDHKQRRTAVGRTPLDEWSASRRDLYLTTHNTHKKQISMPPVVFEHIKQASGCRPTP